MTRSFATVAAAVAIALGAMVATRTSHAHPAPSSSIDLELGPRAVHAELLLPTSELAYAVAPPLDEDAVARYLPRHVSVETPDGAPWTIAVSNVHATDIDGHAYFSAAIDLTPPAGAPVRSLVLVDDAIMHEVRNHVLVVRARNIDAHASVEPEIVGFLQYPMTRLPIRHATPQPDRRFLLALGAPAVVLFAWKLRRGATRRGR